MESIVTLWNLMGLVFAKLTAAEKTNIYITFGYMLTYFYCRLLIKNLERSLLEVTDDELPLGECNNKLWDMTEHLLAVMFTTVDNKFTVDLFNIAMCIGDIDLEMWWVVNTVYLNQFVHPAPAW
eukprot:m51a1_g11262 hypothetical protein (124) ;mRNA; r:32263-32634